jgi:hypothetical protein
MRIPTPARWASVSGLVTALCAANAGCAPRPATALHVAWQENQRYLYAVELTSRAALGDGKPFDFALAAKLEVVPTRVRGEEVELALALKEPVLKVAGQTGGGTLDELAASLQRSCLLTLERGRAREMRFARDLSPIVVSVHRTLATAFELTPPPAHGRVERWTATEHDGTGEYEAEYRIGGDPGAVSKRKLRYTTLLLAGGIDAARRAQVTPRIVSSKGEMRVSQGAIASALVDDEVESQVLSRSTLAARTTLVMRLATGSPHAVAALPDRTAVLAETVAYAAERAYVAVRASGMFDRAQVGGRTFEEILAALETAARDPRQEELWGSKNGVAVPGPERAAREEWLRARTSAFAALVALLRLEPEAVVKAERAARGGSIAARALVDGLAAAGTEGAQAALAAVSADGGLPRLLRVQAANGFGMIREPTPAAVHALATLLDDPLLQEHALFGLGTAAFRLRGLGEGERSRAISALLGARLAAAHGPDEQVRCLRALANAADPATLAIIRPFAAAGDRAVRAAAVEAARLMDSAAADTFVSDRMTNDRDPQVRMAAIRAARMRRPCPVLDAALSTAALHDDNVAARRDAVELLGRWLHERPALRATLERVARQDPKEEVRATSRAALQGT